LISTTPQPPPPPPLPYTTLFRSLGPRHHHHRQDRVPQPAQRGHLHHLERRLGRSPGRHRGELRERVHGQDRRLGLGLRRGPGRIDRKGTHLHSSQVVRWDGVLCP